MKKLGMFLMLLLAFTIQSHHVFAQSVTITLMPGWNWISVPLMDTLDFETALGSFTPVAGDMIKSQWSNAIYSSNGQWRGPISQFYPGYGYMYKSNRPMPVTVTFNVQQPAPQVIVTTAEPMLITAISAMGGGEVTVSDGTYIIAKGLCWATHENPTTNDDFFIDAGSGVGSFTSSMTDLNISTTYYVRSYAVTANGTYYGEQKTFTTREIVLTTVVVMDISAASATCAGSITDDGGLLIIDCGVCWSTSPNPTILESEYSNGCWGNEDFSFICFIPILFPNTTYYVRAYAITDAGTTYGEQNTFTTLDGIPTITTTEISNIQGASATSGGNITDDGGLEIWERGVCWSILPNPTVADSHTINGYGTGSYTSHINALTVGTTYYVRAYATNSFYTVYGNQISFTTVDNQNWIDLGLPSGILWATCNVGADTPEDYGDYFAWGETEPKDDFSWESYKYCNGSQYSLTKYCTVPHYCYNGFTDSLSMLLPEDDAATANWGGDWRMPTKDEWIELYQNTVTTLTTLNGVNGRLFTAANGNSLFLPAAGYGSGSYAGNQGYYWSGSLYTVDPGFAWDFCFYSEYYSVYGISRCSGQSVRPVRSAE